MCAEYVYVYLFIINAYLWYVFLFLKLAGDPWGMSALVTAANLC